MQAYAHATPDRAPTVKPEENSFQLKQAAIAAGAGAATSVQPVDHCGRMWHCFQLILNCIACVQLLKDCT